MKHGEAIIPWLKGASRFTGVFRRITWIIREATLLRKHTHNPPRLLPPPLPPTPRFAGYQASKWCGEHTTAPEQRSRGTLGASAAGLKTVQRGALRGSQATLRPQKSTSGEGDGGWAAGSRGALNGGLSSQWEGEPLSRGWHSPIGRRIAWEGPRR